MNLIEESYKRLYPEKEFNYLADIKYSGKFRSFNANIRCRGNHITLNLSKDWKNIDSEITIGLVQELLIKLFKSKKPWEQSSQGAGKMHSFFQAHTKNIDMYTHFIKSLHNYVPKTKNDPVLESSFIRINDRYFDGLLEKPNLEFGKRSFTKLGCYSYATDTITISSALKDDLELVDYIMYHELLHKKHQFYSKNGRNFHHTHLFREKEKQFPNAELLEKRLKRLKIKNFFRLF